MQVTLNINEQVTVHLTDKGREIYLQQAHTSLKPNQRKITMSLWMLMSIFGPHLFNGGPLPFEKNEITIAP